MFDVRCLKITPKTETLREFHFGSQQVTNTSSRSEDQEEPTLNRNLELTLNTYLKYYWIICLTCFLGYVWGCLGGCFGGYLGVLWRCFCAMLRGFQGVNINETYTKKAYYYYCVNILFCNMFNRSLWLKPSLLRHLFVWTKTKYATLNGYCNCSLQRLKRVWYFWKVWGISLRGLAEGFWMLMGSLRNMFERFGLGAILGCC